MRIAIVNELWTAGATRCARDLQRGLQGRHDVRYFPEARRLSVEEQLSQLEDFQPDIVHLHSFYGDLPYSILRRISSRYRTVFTPHDPFPIGSHYLECWSCSSFKNCFACPVIGDAKRYTLVKHSPYLQRWRKRVTHALVDRQTTIVCVSEWMKSRMAHTELGRFRLRRIYNGIDTVVFRRDHQARAKLKLGRTDVVISFVAHHAGWTADKRKGGHVLARALAEIVIPRFPGLIVLAVGGGMIPNIPNVRPVGFVSPQDISTYYSASDAFIAPSLADNLPYTVLEAMACGVPVVASNVGGIPEQVAHNVSGVLFEAGNHEALGAAIIEVLSSGRGPGLGGAGLERVKARFELEAFILAYEAVYRERLERCQK
jgi:glycosyltransferase involved in cell wall biosynthesis